MKTICVTALVPDDSSDVELAAKAAAAALALADFAGRFASIEWASPTGLGRREIIVTADADLSHEAAWELAQMAADFLTGYENLPLSDFQWAVAHSGSG